MSHRLGDWKKAEVNSRMRKLEDGPVFIGEEEFRTAQVMITKDIK